MTQLSFDLAGRFPVRRCFWVRERITGRFAADSCLTRWVNSSADAYLFDYGRGIYGFYFSTSPLMQIAVYSDDWKEWKTDPDPCSRTFLLGKAVVEAEEVWVIR